MNVKAFISYAHESDARCEQVLKLAQQLRRDGVDCSIDQFVNGSPLEGWPLWMERQIEWADFVLVTGSPGYLCRYEVREAPGRGLGVAWEGAVIRVDLYEAAARNAKFIPILFNEDPRETLPKPLRSHTHYRLFDDYEKLLRTLTMQPIVLPEAIGRIPTLPPLNISVEAALAAHRRALTARATKHDWWSRAIPLQAVGIMGEECQARNALQNWLHDEKHQHCIILGDPGAGKSGLIWWTASQLATLDNAVALVVPAAKLRRLTQVTLASLAEIAEPRIEIALRPNDLLGRQTYLLLDGLDELVGAEVGGDKLASELLGKVLNSVPASSRVIAACRTPAFALIGQEFQNNLPSDRALSDSSDPYNLAIARALGLERRSVLIVRIQSVSPMDAAGFLERNSISNQLIQIATTSSKIIPFLSTPFSLRLLTLALPQLVTQKSIAIDDLYKIYIKAVLSREKFDLSENEFEDILSDLRRAANNRRTRMSEQNENLSRSAGLIYVANGKYEFSHYSLWEYFLASEILNQMSSYDSTTISRLDFVSAYNINRMLVPMVLRTLERRAGTANLKVRAVSASEYRKFRRATGWREMTGYGLHPSKTRSRDGTPSATFSIDQREAWSIHHSLEHEGEVACALSWYDAAVFAMHARARLPTIVQAKELSLRGDYLFWCSDWHTEKVAHINVFDARVRQVQGLNPDVRLPQTALAIVGS